MKILLNRALAQLALWLKLWGVAAGGSNKGWHECRTASPLAGEHQCQVLGNQARLGFTASSTG